MSNHSEFIILVGTGHPYGGEGLLIHDTLSLHGDKGGWLGQTAEGHIYWCNSGMEDALLIISLCFVAPHSQEAESQEYSFCQLRQKAEKLFKVSLFEPGLDTQDHRHIAPQDLQSLYRANKKVLAHSDVKLVGIRLGVYSITQKGRDPRREEFQETVKAYALDNVEWCETVYGRFRGGFDDAVREYKGTVIPLA